MFMHLRATSRKSDCFQLPPPPPLRQGLLTTTNSEQFHTIRAHEVQAARSYRAIKSGNVTIPIYRVENKRHSEAGSPGMIRITNDTKSIYR